MKVFLDIDGVLADFMKPAMAVHGIHYYQYPIRAGWDIVEACNILKPGCNMTPERFWGAFHGSEFWAKLPKTHLCDPLIGSLQRYVGLENVCLLSCREMPGSVDGGIEWIKNNLPRVLWKQRLFGKPKRFCAGPGTLLIDDNDDNVNEFWASGGDSILVPRPWNTKWANKLSTSFVLDQLISRFP